MDILSFLLGMAGEIAKTLIIDFVRDSKKKQSQEEQQTEIRRLVAEELAKRQNIAPAAPPLDVLTKQVLEQIGVLAKNPDFPLKVQDGKLVLRESPSPKPFIGSTEKWEEKEIQARLWQLEQVMKNRQAEIESLSQPKVTSRLPPLEEDSSVSLGAEPNHDRSHRDWKRRMEETADRIDKRRQEELKKIKKRDKSDDGAYS